MDYYYLDFETLSSENIKETGAAKYLANAKALLMGIAKNDSPVYLWDASASLELEEGNQAEALLEEICPRRSSHGEAAMGGSPKALVAHNAAFELGVLREQLMGDRVLPDYVLCTSYLTFTTGFGASLSKATQQIGGASKGAEGSRLIRKLHNGGTLTPEEHADFREYCKKDVEVCRGIVRYFWSCLPLIWDTDYLQDYLLLEKVNHAGLPIDLASCQEAIRQYADAEATQGAEFTQITGLRPSQNVACLRWFQRKGYPLNSLSVASRRQIIQQGSLQPSVLKALKIYDTLSKRAQKKLHAMVSYGQPTDQGYRARGCFQFRGAHSGRATGRHIQPQNMARHTHSVEEAETYMGYLEREETMPELLDRLPTMVRHFIRPPQGKKLLIGDYKSIEPRVLFWLSGETQALKDIADPKKDIYVQFAAQIFGKPSQEVSSHERNLGKMAVLGCGYGMGAKRFREQAETMFNAPVDEATAFQVVNGYRRTFFRSVELWKSLSNALYALTQAPTDTEMRLHPKLTGVRRMLSEEEALTFIQLPGGRSIVYRNLIHCPQDGFRYVSHQTLTPKAVYGGSLVENLVQAIAADILHYAALRAPHTLIALVHDELVVEAPDTADPQELAVAMEQKPPWLDTVFPLDVKAFEAPFYIKD